MKTVKITTRASADRLQLTSLFHPVNGGTLARERYDLGKYRAAMVGRELQVADHVAAVWSERRKDSDGVYFGLWCLSARCADILNPPTMKGGAA